MSDEKALLAAIWEHPQEDAARLVYADWLQETGELLKVARAEFIRLQCELARIARTDPRRDELSRKADALKKKHSGKWKSTTNSFVRQADYERGFPYPKRSVRICRFKTISEAEWAEAPLWNIALVQHSRKAFVALPNSPNLLRIGRLSLETGEWRDRLMHPDDVIQLLRSPNMRNLGEFVAHHHRIGLRPFLAMADSPPLPHLTSIHAVGCTREGRTLPALLASGYPAQLTNLTWEGNLAVADEVVEMFRTASRFARLQSLRLQFLMDSAVDPKTALAACEPFPELHSLCLWTYGPGDDLAEMLAAWPGLAHLRSLTLLDEIGMRGAEALVKSPHAPASFAELFYRPMAGVGAEVLQLLTDRFGEGVCY